jgi:hypothetical protein
VSLYGRIVRGWCNPKLSVAVFDDEAEEIDSHWFFPRGSQSSYLAPTSYHMSLRQFSMAHSSRPLR